MPLVDECLKTLRASVPKQFLWLVADEAILRAIRRKTKVERGRRGNAIRILLSIAKYQWLQFSAIFAICLLDTARLLLLQRRRSDTDGGLPKSEAPLSVFVGFGARAEERLFESYSATTSGTVVRVNQIDIASMARIRTVGALELYSEVLSVFHDLRRSFTCIPREFDAFRLDWMVFAAMRLGTYAHARSWFRSLRQLAVIREACFLTPDTTAFAAIDAGACSHFYQHGLLGKNLILPSFCRVSALTNIEAAYIREMIGNVDIQTTLAPCKPVKIEGRKALIVASARRNAEDMQLANPIVTEAESLGIRTHVRPFIGEDLRQFWKSSNAPKTPFTIELASGSFNELIEKLGAIFVVSWGSTSLVDALYMGIIPICIAKCDDHYVEDTVFPLLRSCLHWPRDRELIRKASQSQAVYGNVVRQLHAELHTAEKFKFANP